MSASKKVYIVHGWSYTLDKWTKFCDHLRSAGYEPVQLRVPGLTSPSKKVWDIKGYVNWLDKELKNEKHPLIIAHSNGGRIALMYAQTHPGRIKQLVLIDGAGVVHDELVKQLKLKTLRGLSKVGKPLAKIPYVKKATYKFIGAQDYRDAAPNMRKTMQNMLAANKLLKLSQIDLPITLIWGRDDKLTPLEDGKTMERELPNAKLHVIEGGRHSPFLTHPDEVAKLAIKGLGK